MENIGIVKELMPGTVLCNGKYTIAKKIGAGGFGITYLAVQSGLDRRVCIKEYFLDGRCVRNTRAKTVHCQTESVDMYEKYRRAFVQEAKTLAKLRHPNIVEVLEVFDENNTSYMVMSFIEGVSLQSIVERRGKIPHAEAVNYIGQIADAVGYVHSKNILHRDIKPDNIMITADYRAILIDFGSARSFVQDKTQVQTAIVSSGYAPTEQYTANSRKGAYTDIYAIGATFYFALTGQVPIAAAARLSEKMPTPKELVPTLPDDIDRTIQKAMQVKAENRHQTVEEFMNDLRHIKPSVLVDEFNIKRNLRWVWYSLGGALVVIAALMWYLWVGQDKLWVQTKDFTGMGMYPMVKVKGGTFIMGTDNDRMQKGDCPPHPVTLDDFYIGQLEVSQGFWKRIMGDDTFSEYKPEHYRGQPLSMAARDSFPVENAPYYMVEEFIRRLNEKTGQNFALPTEAQWEYAARSGRKMMENECFSGPDESVWVGKPHPRKVIEEDAKKSVNRLGIYQMCGNVAEWCRDYYDTDFYSQSYGSRNPVNMVENDKNVVRGGSFDDAHLGYATVFYRGKSGFPSETIGFRLVKEL